MSEHIGVTGWGERADGMWTNVRVVYRGSGNMIIFTARMITKGLTELTSYKNFGCKCFVPGNSVSIISLETLLDLFHICEGVLRSILISTGIHRCHVKTLAIFTASHLYERHAPLEHLFAHHVLQSYMWLILQLLRTFTRNKAASKSISVLMFSFKTCTHKSMDHKPSQL